MIRSITVRRKLRDLSGGQWLLVTFVLLSCGQLVIAQFHFAPSPHYEVEHAPQDPAATPEPVVALPLSAVSSDQRLTRPCLQDYAYWGASRYRSCWTYEANTYRQFSDCLRRWEVACDGTK